MKPGSSESLPDLYDSDTLIAELNDEGDILAEYTWGLLGPIDRLDLHKTYSHEV